MQIENDLSHILIYTNSIINSNKVFNYINGTIHNIIKGKNIYCNSIHSKTTKGKTSFHLEKFKNAEIGIITSVYQLGEGTDIPELDCVIFAEKMTSDIRIIQSALRTNRLNKNKPNKIGKIIIPYYNTMDIRNLIEKLSSDHKVNDKIFVKNYSNNKTLGIYGNTVGNNRNNMLIIELLSIDVSQILPLVKILLSITKELFLEEKIKRNLYDNYVVLNKNNNIRSSDEFKEKYLLQFIEDFGNDPEKYFGSNIWSNWSNFLGVDTSKFLNKTMWRKFCLKNAIFTYENCHKEYDILANKYLDILPQNPSDFYMDFKNLTAELYINVSFDF